MFSHVFVGVTDFDRAYAFYTALMDALGIPLRFCERERPWAGWQTPDGPRPLFLIGTPFDGAPHGAGNGQMVAFLADRGLWGPQASPSQSDPDRPRRRLHLRAEPDRHPQPGAREQATGAAGAAARAG
jgi:catechol 2,3-dioxygenase-like lactoylglutathione lyase family enzyme